MWPCDRAVDRAAGAAVSARAAVPRDAGLRVQLPGLPGAALRGVAGVPGADLSWLPGPAARLGGGGHPLASLVRLRA